MSVNDHAILEARSITKRFGAVEALKGVDLQLFRGEILGLIGANGAGKSTFLKICCGALTPTSGELYFDRRRVFFKNPREALREGITSVYQFPAVVEELTVVENFFMGHELLKRLGPFPFKCLDWKRMRKEVEEYIRGLGFTFDVRKKVKELSGGERQLLTVARAFYFNPKIVLLDEPVTALSVIAKREVFTLLKKLRDKYKTSMIFVTHNLEDATNLCDRILIMRLGKIVYEFKPEEGILKEEIYRKMIGG